MTVSVSVPGLTLPTARSSDTGHPVPNFNSAVVTRSCRVGVEVCISDCAVRALCRAAARAFPCQTGKTARRRVEIVIIIPSAARVALLGTGTGVLTY